MFWHQLNKKADDNLGCVLGSAIASPQDRHQIGPYHACPGSREANVFEEGFVVGLRAAARRAINGRRSGWSSVAQNGTAAAPGRRPEDA